MPFAQTVAKQTLGSAALRAKEHYVSGAEGGKHGSRTGKGWTPARVVGSAAELPSRETGRPARALGPVRALSRDRYEYFHTGRTGSTPGCGPTRWMRPAREAFETRRYAISFFGDRIRNRLGLQRVWGFRISRSSGEKDALASLGQATVVLDGQDFSGHKTSQ